MINQCQFNHPFLPAPQLNGESFGTEKSSVLLHAITQNKIKFEKINNLLFSQKNIKELILNGSLCLVLITAFLEVYCRKKNRSIGQKTKEKEWNKMPSMKGVSVPRRKIWKNQSN